MKAFPPSLQIVGVALAGAALTACSSMTGAPSAGSARLGPAVGAPLKTCADLAQAFRFDQTRVDAVSTVPAGSLKLAGQPVAEHCLVKGAMHPRKGSDGRDYAIGFEMRLPKDWNGRFYYQGNGGLDGMPTRSRSTRWPWATCSACRPVWSTRSRLTSPAACRCSAPPARCTASRACRS